MMSWLVDGLDSTITSRDECSASVDLIYEFICFMASHMGSKSNPEFANSIIFIIVLKIKSVLFILIMKMLK